MPYVRNKNIRFKDYKIYNIQPISDYKYKNFDKHIVEVYANSQFVYDFQKDFINKFCKENFDELTKYTLWAKHLPTFNFTQIPYKKDWLYNSSEIGMDMLEEEYGIFFGCWSGHGNSLAIPLSHPEMIEFVETYPHQHIIYRKKRLW